MYYGSNSGCAQAIVECTSDKLALSGPITDVGPISELNVDNWNDNCEAKSEAKSPRPLRGLQVHSSLTRHVPYAVR